MGILGKPEIAKLIEDGELVITSLVPEEPFHSKKQITEDSIDLRLGISGLRYKEKIMEIDTLFQKDIDDCFETVEIPTTGYKLEPGKVLFASTLEIVCLATSKYIGRVYGRSTFARYGLSVHCTQPKFPPGIAWAFPLQLVNHNNIPIIIYPYSYIAQLQIETTSSQAISYDGKYDRDVTLHPPKIDARELEAVKEATGIKIVKEAMAEKLKQISEVVRDFEERESQKKGKMPNNNRARYIVIEIVLGVMAAAFFGYVGNLLASPMDNYWKIVATVLSLILGLIFLALLIAIKFTSKFESVT